MAPDLTLLSWCLGEVRQSLAQTESQLDAALANGDPAASALGSAKASLHQAHGALQLVSVDGVSQLTQQAEALIDAMQAAEVALDDARIQALRRAFHAVLEYCEGLLHQQMPQPLFLFPYYRDLLAARGAERAQPSDLFFPDLSIRPPASQLPVGEDDPQLLAHARSLFERGLLTLMRTPQGDGAQSMQDAVAMICASRLASRHRGFWWVAQALFDSLSDSSLPVDVDVKRLLARFNLQLRKLMLQQFEPDERLLVEMLFLLAHVAHPNEACREVRRVYRLDDAIPADYETARYDPLDPRLLADAQAALERCHQTLEALARGSLADLTAFGEAIDAFVLLCERIPAEGLRTLAKAFTQVRQVLLARQTVPAESIALDIATAILFAEQAIAEGAKPGSVHDLRGADMATRLTAGFAIGGSDEVAIPDWLRELNLAALERRAMLSFVEETRAELHEIEQGLDAVFRDPQQRERLMPAARALERIAMSLSLLDEQDASDHVRLMAARIAHLERSEQPASQPVCDKLADSIGALSFYLDSLLQPAGSERHFEFDSERDLGDELMLEASTPQPAPAVESPIESSVESPIESPVESPVESPTELPDRELLEVFLAEATEVLEQIAAATIASRAQPAQQEPLTRIRRGFHTLKGSSRMVGLDAFGEAAWALERLLNAWLATQQPGSEALYDLVDESSAQFGAWVAVLSTNPQAVSAIDPATLVADADALGEVLQETLAEPAVAPQAGLHDEPQHELSDELFDDQSEDLVLIGERRLNRALYMIFLSEADELIETLCSDALEWQQQPARGASQTAIRAAHTLAGSSAIVGLAQVQLISRQIEQFLLTQLESGLTPADTDLQRLVQLTDRVRTMLHQFAGGAEPREDEEALEIGRLLGSDATLDPHEEITIEALADEESYEEILEAPHEQAVEEVLQAPSEEGVAAQATIDDIDDIDPELLPVFVEEASDQMPQIGENLRRWQAAPGDSRIAQNLMRQLHTVKGSARMAGAMALGQLLHQIETRVEALAAQASISASEIEALISEHDRADALFERMRQGEPPTQPEPPAQSEPIKQPEPTPQLDTALDAEAQPGSDTSEPEPVLLPETVVAPMPPAEPEERTEPQQLVRVRADLLDRLVNEAGEVSIARSRLDNELAMLRQSLGELTENVSRLRAQLREVEIQAESQIQARIAQQRDHERSFDPLEFDRFTRSQELTRMLAESVNDVGTVQQNAARSLEEASRDLHRQGQVLRDLQQNLMRLRMLRFGSIADRLHRVVRQTARELDKRVHLEIRGSEVELDRSVLERMAGPIEHLLRNAVTHGIESASVRQAAGKPQAGQLLIEAQQDGRDIVLMFSDDGAGLDFARIRDKAIASGLLDPNAQVSPRELADLIFTPGLTTADSVTEIAGRGVGMDVVRSEVAGLGGRIETESTPGQGTRFRIVLPLTLAVAQVVLASAGDHRYAISASSVEQLLQMKPKQLAQAYGRGQLDWGGGQVPLYYLGTLLELPDLTPSAQHHAPVLILRSGTQRIALHCDQVSRNQDVVVKAVGPQLAQVRGITGATVLGSGEVVLILNPVAIAQPRSGAPAAPTLDKPAISAMLADAQPPLVMVVDDSLTVRKVTQRLLLREGYQVLLARDGVDALRQLADTMPDVMLVDIEMPRMDGFDLTRNIRGDSQYAHIPIIMITSRTADKHRSFAMSLGVDAYLGKPYAEQELLERIADLVARGKDRKAQV